MSLMLAKALRCLVSFDIHLNLLGEKFTYQEFIYQDKLYLK